MTSTTNKYLSLKSITKASDDTRCIKRSMFKQNKNKNFQNFPFGFCPGTGERETMNKINKTAHHGYPS